MLNRLLTTGAFSVALAFAGLAAAQAPASTHNDYANRANWLCWPGRAGDACTTDLDATAIAADGARRIERFKADPAAPIDCFYVYPTVSRDPGVLSDMTVKDEERRVVVQQFARFGAKCRLYAPMYRQFTLTALVSRMSGKPPAGAGTVDLGTPYRDVVDAWNYYLEHENHGRGVVLVGHSQGSGLLTQLIKNEIDGKPHQALLVSAILMGTSLAVPAGADVGGDFKHIALCRRAGQLGCVIAYASFRDTAPPPENSRFGRPRKPQPGLVAACVNPANLAGGEGALHSYFPANASGTLSMGAPTPPPWTDGPPIETPFVAVPGLLTARCVPTPRFSYLAIHVNAGDADRRAHDIPGDVVIGGVVQGDWGLHLIDANLAMGDLVAIVGQESAAWAHRRR